MDFIYEVEKEEEIIEDFQVLAEGMKLLQYDYLGGNGSRGYGKVKFRGLAADVVIGQVPEDIMAECGKLLKDV